MRGKRNDADVLHRELEACARSRMTSPAQLAGVFDRFSSVARADLHHIDRRRLFRDMPMRYPRLSGRVEVIRAERIRLDRELEQLTQQASSLERADDLTLTSFRNRTRDLVADLRRLDSEETDLLQTAYWRVNGAGD